MGKKNIQGIIIFDKMYTVYSLPCQEVFILFLRHLAGFSRSTVMNYPAAKQRGILKSIQRPRRRWLVCLLTSLWLAGGINPRRLWRIKFRHDKILLFFGVTNQVIEQMIFSEDQNHFQQRTWGCRQGRLFDHMSLTEKWASQKTSIFSK